jgi:uncharacterized membrane protein
LNIFKYLVVFLVSMVPVLELRFSMGLATSETFMGGAIPFWIALPLCVIGNMIPVPFIYFFARRFLAWGAEKRFIGKICRFFLVKGEKVGQKLTKSGQRRGGLFLAMMLFVGIPIPGTGAWTGTLGASFLDMGFKSTVVSVCLGVIMAGIIMALIYTGAFEVIGQLLHLQGV